MKSHVEPFGTLTRLILIAAAVAGLQACGATAGGTINNPFTKPQEAPVPVYDGHVRTVSSWEDASAETATFTNAITIIVDCDDPDAVTTAQAILARDSRSVIWFAPMFAYGSEGYELRANASACWQREADLIRNNRARSIAVWLLDEPADVAWSFWVDNGTRYDPNRYNGLLTTAAAMVRADFPDLEVGYNFGSLPAGAVVATGITHLGIEAYGADWQQKLQTLETKTPLFIWLMPPAFVDGDPVAADPVLAQRIREEWTWTQHDSRVDGWYWFLWCCDDLITGSKNFYTVSGGQLPLTRQALVDVGAAILRGRP